MGNILWVVKVLEVGQDKSKCNSSLGNADAGGV